MHGYELRKQVHRVLGTVRALSYGTLYPRLRDLVIWGYLREVDRPIAGRRAKITYAVTPAGRERLAHLLAVAGPSAWEDEAFAVDDQCNILVHVERDTLYFDLVKMPNSLELTNILRPRYQIAETKMNPALASEKK